MSPRSTPEDGDVVIRAETRGGKRTYVLHTMPGEDQYVLASREQAAAQAVAFAKRQRVRAWSTNDGSEFVLLEDCRVVESI
jgi:hypothetical protein